MKFKSFEDTANVHSNSIFETVEFLYNSTLLLLDAQSGDEPVHIALSLARSHLCCQASKVRTLAYHAASAFPKVYFFWWLSFRSCASRSLGTTRAITITAASGIMRYEDVMRSVLLCCTNPMHMRYFPTSSTDFDPVKHY